VSRKEGFSNKCSNAEEVKEVKLESEMGGWWLLLLPLACGRGDEMKEKQHAAAAQSGACIRASSRAEI